MEETAHFSHRCRAQNEVRGSVKKTSESQLFSQASPPRCFCLAAIKRRLRITDATTY